MRHSIWISVRLLQFYRSKKFPVDVPEWVRQRQIEMDQLVCNVGWH